MTSLISSEEFKELFLKGEMNVTEQMYGDFLKYADLLCEWGSRMNLTAITDPEGIAQKHFFDSVYPFSLINVPRGTKLIDVGTGAGFPSVPLKIYRRDISLTLLDSLNKRIGFLQAVSSELSLDADCIHGRAEETGRFIKDGNPLRESFDIATARAVTRLRELCEYCLPFVKVGGRFVALKGRECAEEIDEAKNAVSLLGGKISLVKQYSLPDGDMRTLVVIEKVSPTPAKYPRNAGQMKKNKL